jgi:gliding motility-associated-like protein
LKDKENIEELFREGLKDFQTSVDPSVWQGVQTGLGAASGATGGSAIASGKLSILTKAVITLAGVTAVSTGIYFYTVDETSEKEAVIYVPIEKEISVEANEQTIETDDETIALVPENKEAAQEKSAIIAKKMNNTADLKTFTTSERKTTESVNNNGTQNTTENEFPDTNNGNAGLENQASPSSASTGTTSGSAGISSGRSAAGSIVQKGKEETPQRPTLSIALITQKNQFVELSATSNFEGEVEWDMGDGYIVEGKHVEYYFDEPGEYLVKAYAGEVIEEILLKVYREGKITNLPNVMTPNGDGVNDYLFIESEGLATFSIVVFNKQQQVVFSSEDIYFKWDGIHERAQVPCPEGEYYYIITATDKRGNTLNKHQILTIER